MLNVGSNYTSFSNYSPAYRAQCPVQRGHQGGGGQRPGTPPALPGLGAARHGAAGGRDPGGGAAGAGRGGDRCAAILGCLLGGLGQAAAAQPGREAGRGLPRGGWRPPVLGEAAEAAARLFPDVAPPCGVFGSRPKKPSSRPAKADTGLRPGAAAPGRGRSPGAELRGPEHHPRPAAPLSLPGCTWPPAPGSSSPARSRCAGRRGGSCFGPGCSIPPPWGWGRTRCHSLRETRREEGIRGRGGLLRANPGPAPRGGRAKGRPKRCPLHRAGSPGCPWRGEYRRSRRAGGR